MKNMTQFNVTYNPGELAGTINDNPHVDFYMIGYAGLTLGFILIGSTRGKFRFRSDIGWYICIAACWSLLDYREIV